MTVTLQDLRPGTFKMEIVHPFQGPLGIFLEIVGMDSKEYRTESKKFMKARLESKQGAVDLDQMEKDNAALAAACIKSWPEDVFGPYTKENVFSIMYDPEMSWLREQVEVAIQNRHNFFRPAKTTTG